jgi:hypothetical protein
VESFDYYPDIRHQAVGEVAHFNADTPTDTWLIRTGSFPVSEGKVYHDLHSSLHAQYYKFWRGALNACAIVLDESRFSPGKGRYRFRFNLFGVSEEDGHFFVSIYDIHTGDARDDLCTVELSNKKLRGVPARVTANGRATVSKVAEKDYRSTDGKGFKYLYFEYDGAGDVLLVFSASRDSSGGTGSAFDDLSIVAVKHTSPECHSKNR